MTSKHDLSDEEQREKMSEELKPERYLKLMTETFHGSCDVHPSSKKDIFCLFCSLVVCYDCMLPYHRSHPLLEVINVYGHDAVWLDRMNRFIDCDRIQTIEVESEDGEKKLLIALKPKHELKSAGECKKLVQEPFNFCSLSCKVDHVLDEGGELTEIFEMEFLGHIHSTPDRYEPLPSISEYYSPVRDQTSPDRLDDDPADQLQTKNKRGRTDDDGSDDHEADHDDDEVDDPEGQVEVGASTDRPPSGDDNVVNQNVVSDRKRPRN